MTVTVSVAMPPWPSLTVSVNVWVVATLPMQARGTVETVWPAALRHV